jgi:hypothetical protein
MPSTLQDKVEGYIGTVSNINLLSNWLTNSVHHLVDVMPAQRLSLYTAPLTDSGSGVTITNYRVLRAHKSGYGATEFSADLKAQLADSSSIYYATPTCPATYTENGKKYVLPSGGTIIAFQYPKVDNTTASDDSQFIIDFEDLIVLYAVVRGAFYNISNAIATMSALAFSTQGAITIPDLTADLAIISGYIDTKLDAELAGTKINEVVLKLKAVETEISESGLLISQEEKRISIMVQKSVQEIQTLLTSIQMYQKTYDDLLKGLM